ncbi:MAG: CpaF family protein [Acidobacteria bacterium]|nr:CpaF family protein [Acidobacteriota bacterium]
MSTQPPNSPTIPPLSPRARVARPARGFAATADRYVELKTKVHRKLLSSLNTDTFRLIGKDRLRVEIGSAVEQLLMQENIPMTLPERDRVIEEILDEVFGLGPLEPLLKDPTITDILVNNSGQVYIERHGVMQRSAVQFKDNRHLLHIIEKMVAAAGRRVDEANPIVDARLADGSRITAAIPPVALKGPSLAIRRFGGRVLENEELVKNGTLSPAMLEVLGACVKARLNIVICGGSGSGKTTLLNALSRFIPHDERIVTIEDTAELMMQQRHVVRLETRASNIEGQGAITQRDLVINALRMRPDRIIVGEARGAEALDMLQAMNTGHDGSMTTIHANSTRDCFHRIETMVLMANVGLTEPIIRQQTASAIQVVVHTARQIDGTRKISAIAEGSGQDAEGVHVEDIFKFEKLGMDEDRRTIGRFVATGYRPAFLERLAGAGVHLSEELFRAGE